MTGGVARDRARALAEPSPPPLGLAPSFNPSRGVRSVQARRVAPATVSAMLIVRGWARDLTSSILWREIPEPEQNRGPGGASWTLAHGHRSLAGDGELRKGEDDLRDARAERTFATGACAAVERVSRALRAVLRDEGLLCSRRGARRELLVAAVATLDRVAVGGCETGDLGVTVRSAVECRVQRVAFLYERAATVTCELLVAAFVRVREVRGAVRSETAADVVASARVNGGSRAIRCPCREQLAPRCSRRMIGDPVATNATGSRTAKPDHDS